MLFVLFHLDHDRYAIDAREVVEILPLMDVKRLPQAPAGVAGILNYRGTPLPVIDLAAIALGRVAVERLSTRILIVRSAGGRQLALIAEGANETLKREADEFEAAGVCTAPYLGPVTKDAHGLVQWVAPDRLLSDTVREALFQQVGEAA